MWTKFLDEYESALLGYEEFDKKIVKLGELHELTYQDFILLIKTSSSIGKVAFRLVKNAKVKILQRETARWHGTGW